MKIQLGQVKGILPIGLMQEVGGKVGDEKAEGGCKVVSCTNLGIQFFECDIFAIARKNTYIEPHSGRYERVHLGMVTYHG